MRSTGVKLQNSAGTKQPICAMIASRQVWRKHVDLPPMFTPLNKRTLDCVPSPLSVPKERSFGTNSPDPSVLSTHGCRPCTTVMHEDASGGQSRIVARVYPALVDAFASAPSASRRAVAWAAAPQRFLMESNLANIRRIPRALRSFCTSRACSSSWKRSSTTEVREVLVHLLGAFASLPFHSRIARHV